MKKSIPHYLILILICVFSYLHGSEDDRIRVGEIEFSGNRSYSSKRLLKSMLLRPSAFLRQVPFNEKLLQDDLENLKQFYYRNGYLDVRTGLKSFTKDTLKQKINLVIAIEEGEQTHIQAVHISGNRNFTEKQLWPLIVLRPGDALKQELLETSTLNLLRYYADSGYVECTVVPEIQTDSTLHQAAVRYHIQEDKQYRIKNIKIYGLLKIRPRVILRELSFKKNELLQYSRLLNSQRNLYLTGLFESAFILPDTSRQRDDNKKDIHVVVKETDYREINFLFGYGSVDQLRGQLEIQNRNTWGIGCMAALKAKASFIQRSIEAAYSDPWLMKVPVRMDLLGFIRWQEEPGFYYMRTGGSLTLGIKVSRPIQLKMEGRTDWSKMLKVRIQSSRQEVPDWLQSLKITALLDSRNSLYNPRWGLYCEISGEQGKIFSGGSSDYTRLQADLRCLINLSTGFTIGSAIQAGWMSMPGGLKNIPLQERFYAGGPNSIRGFSYRGIGPKDIAGLSTGGQIKLVWHVLELRKSVWRTLGFTFFTDCGQVWENDHHISPADLRWSAGFGLTVTTSIGVIRTEYGWVLHRKPGEAPGQWIITIGHSF